jgi:hypothetical protein
VWFVLPTVKRAEEKLPPLDTIPAEKQWIILCPVIADLILRCCQHIVENARLCGEEVTVNPIDGLLCLLTI